MADDEEMVTVVYVKWRTGENPWVFKHPGDAMAKYREIVEAAKEEDEPADVRVFTNVKVQTEKMDSWQKMIDGGRRHTQDDMTVIRDVMKQDGYTERRGSEMERLLIEEETRCPECSGPCWFEGWVNEEGHKQSYATCMKCGTAVPLNL